MKPFINWCTESANDLPKPWLVLGKGPSLAGLSNVDTEAFVTVSLNHVVRETAVDVAHVIDIEVIADCAASLENNARYVVMPWVPHVRGERGLVNRETFFHPGQRSLPDYLDDYPVLRRLDDAGRLLWYNLGTAPAPHADQPVVNARTFSAAAVVKLLALAGVDNIRTLGVDGGSAYSNRFDDLVESTRLQTYQTSFDAQFEEIAATMLTHRLDFAPLDLEQPIAVFVGTQPEQMLATLVLEYSIRRHTSMNVSVKPLHKAVRDADINIPTPKNPALRPRTPFSFQRFAIPALKHFKGRAIYLDSDMQVFADLRKLWTAPMDDADVLAVDEPIDSGRRPQFSVMVLDCEALAWEPRELVAQLDAGRWSYEELMYQMAAARRVRRTLPATWNDLERYREGETHLTHYTDMNSQPWLSAQNRLGKVWCQGLFDAISDGFLTPGTVEDHVRRGWVRPSLMTQLEHHIVDPLLLPDSVQRRDRTSFVPPHRTRAGSHGLTGFGHYPSPLQRFARRTYAVSRLAFERSGARDLARRGRRRLDRFRRATAHR